MGPVGVANSSFLNPNHKLKFTQKIMPTIDETKATGTELAEQLGFCMLEATASRSFLNLNPLGPKARLPSLA